MFICKNSYLTRSYLKSGFLIFIAVWFLTFSSQIVYAQSPYPIVTPVVGVNKIVFGFLPYYTSLHMALPKRMVCNVNQKRFCPRRPAHGPRKKDGVQPNYALSPEQWSREKYGPVFVDSYRLAGNLDRLLKPQETFYEFGNETGLYFASRRSPPAWIFYVWALIDTPMRQKWTDRLMTQLHQAPPDVIVLNSSGKGFLPYFSKQYRFLTFYPADQTFAIFVKNGSALQARLDQQPSSAWTGAL